MALDVTLDIATTLATRLALTLGTDVFKGPVRAARDGVPARAIFVTPTGGPPGQIQRDISPPTELRENRVQIRVRSGQEDYAGGDTLARSVIAALSFNPPTSPAGYKDVRALQPQPIYLRKDEQGLHEWSTNFEVWTEETI